MQCPIPISSTVWESDVEFWRGRGKPVHMNKLYEKCRGHSTQNSITSSLFIRFKISYDQNGEWASIVHQQFLAFSNRNVFEEKKNRFLRVEVKRHDWGEWPLEVDCSLWQDTLTQLCFRVNWLSLNTESFPRCQKSFVVFWLLALHPLLT